MKLTVLLAVYAAAGFIFAFVVYAHLKKERTGKRVSASLLAIPLWPLWIPFVLRDEGSQLVDSATTARSQRIARALAEGFEAARGSSLESLLSKETVDRMTSEVARAESRMSELDAILSQPAFSPQAAKRRVEELEKQNGEARVLATARLHLANVERLAQLRQRDAEALDELEALARALRTQLLLARYAGSSLAGAGGLVQDMWIRVEGLGEALDIGQNSVQNTEST